MSSYFDVAEVAEMQGPRTAPTALEDLSRSWWSLTNQEGFPLRKFN